ncbi:hypothetical protein ACHAQA_005655 [Verticillium albo-atrum]
MSAYGDQSHAGFGQPALPAEPQVPSDQETNAAPEVEMVHTTDPIQQSNLQDETQPSVDPETIPRNPFTNNPVHRAGQGTPRPAGRPRVRTTQHLPYPACDACESRSRACSQFRPCAACHTEGEACTNSRGDADDNGPPWKRPQLPILEGPCASCVATGTSEACDANHGLRIECTPCADMRAIRDPDHECTVSDALYLAKRSQWTRAPYDAVEQVVTWGCEGCARRSNRGCDVDPRVDVGCSECAVRGEACRFVPDRREPGVVRTLGRRPVRGEFAGGDPGPAWWRRRCGRCAARGLRCGWLLDYRDVGHKCSNCVSEQREKREVDPTTVVLCHDAENGYALCETETEDRRDDGSLVMPTSTVPSTPGCTACRKGGGAIRCQVYEGMEHLACVRCTAWGLPCFDMRDEAGRPSGAGGHPGVYPQPKPYGDLQRVGWGRKSMMEYPACNQCKVNDLNCDRQRPCDSCMQHGTVYQCTSASRAGDLPAGLLMRDIFTDAGVLPADVMYPPTYYMAMGFGPLSVDDVRKGPVQGIGIPGPQWGMWQVLVPDPDDPKFGDSRSGPQERRLVRRGDRAAPSRIPLDVRAVEEQVQAQDDNITMDDAPLDLDVDLNNDDLDHALHNDYPTFEPPAHQQQEDLDDADITARLNALFDASDRLPHAVPGAIAPPPVKNPRDPLWLVTAPERVLLSLQSGDPEAVCRHPWAPLDDSWRRSDHVKHPLTPWRRPSATNFLAAISDEPDVLAPNDNNPSPRRAALDARALVHAALVREWRAVHFAADRCVICKFRAAAPGPGIIHCSVCAGVVQDDGANLGGG